jgi:hypothetical protein
LWAKQAGIIEFKLTRGLKKDTDIVVKAHQSTSELFFAFHNNPNVGSGAFVNKFCKSPSPTNKI